MNWYLIVASITTFCTFLAVIGFFLMRAKFSKELKSSKKREEEFARKAYETAILKEIGDRIGYSLDGAKIVEIISGSLGELLPYSTVCYMIFDDKNDKILFACNVNESVSPKYIEDIKHKLLISSSEMAQRPFLNFNIDTSISGNILDDESQDPVKSYFNVPIIISGKLVGVINVSSTKENLYDDENTEVLYRIAHLASQTASKLQAVLDREKNRLLQAVQALSDGLLMVDTKYQLVLVNRKLCYLLETVADPSLFDIANSLSGTLDLRSMIEESLGSEEDLPTKEINVKEKTLQVMASKVLDKTTQKPMGVVVLFHDATDSRNLEKLRQDFTSMMVHELRSPLTSIKSTAEMLKTDLTKLKEKDVTSYLSTIDTTSLSMLELVNDLLDVAKMEAGKFDVVVETGEVGQYVKEGAESFRPLVMGKKLKLNIDIAEDLPRGNFDKVRIRQVLNNLISNGVKFTQNGEITVKVSKEIVNGHPIDILVSVSDTGMGIDPEEATKLFSRFGQLVRGHRTVALKGSGLGLYIAKGIVEAWGGRVWFKSEGAGLGTTFYFTIPIAEDENIRKGNAEVSHERIAQA